MGGSQAHGAFGGTVSRMVSRRAASSWPVLHGSAGTDSQNVTAFGDRAGAIR